MRDLSGYELKLAPEWAAYFAPDDNDVLFISKCKTRACWLVEDFDLESGVDMQDEFEFTKKHEELLECIIPIMDKHFDINNHEFSDGYLSASIDGDALCMAIELDSFNAYAKLDKRDAIAIAKALGVTADDLK